MQTVVASVGIWFLEPNDGAVRRATGGPVKTIVRATGKRHRKGDNNDKPECQGFASPCFVEPLFRRRTDLLCRPGWERRLDPSAQLEQQVRHKSRTLVPAIARRPHESAPRTMSGLTVLSDMRFGSAIPGRETRRGAVGPIDLALIMLSWVFAARQRVARRISLDP